MPGKTIVALDPTAEARTVQREPNPLPADLNGKVLGFLNGDGAGQYIRIDLLFKEVLRTLQQRYQIKEVVWGEKFRSKNSQGASEETLDNLAQKCDLVVNGIGV